MLYFIIGYNCFLLKMQTNITLKIYFYKFTIENNIHTLCIPPSIFNVIYCLRYKFCTT